MNTWSQYQERGIWGLWWNFFAATSGELSVGISYEDSAWLFEPSNPILQTMPQLPARGVFSWGSSNGFELALYSTAVPGERERETWQLLMEYEQARPALTPTFLPFLPPGIGTTALLNERLFSAPPALLLNGQPGTGKAAVLQCLALLHAGQRLTQAPFSEYGAPEFEFVLVPELALLEISEQDYLMKRAKKGVRIWGATVYDVQTLLGRKIITPAVYSFFEAVRIVLPAAQKRDAAELQAAQSFWRALYGADAATANANLDFVRRRTLGLESISVESILEEGRGLRGVVAEMEKEAIRRAQARVGRSQHKVARLLKVSRGSLQHKLRKYELESEASDADNEDGA